MKLVVYSRFSVEEMEKWVVSKFSLVPFVPDAVSWTGSELPLKEQHLMKKIFVKPVKKLRYMTISWQLPSLHSKYNLKGPEFLSHFLGHEGKGSILSYLKSKGYATGLSSGIATDTNGFAIFEISIDLTKSGLVEHEEIALAVFAYLDLIKRDGLNPVHFEEQKKINEIRFQYLEKGKAIDFATHTASNMQKYRIEDVFWGPFRYDTLDKEFMSSLVEYFSVCNSRMVLIDDELQGQFLREKWYDTEFFVQEYDLKFIEKCETFCIDELELPKQNPFIPEKFHLITVSVSSSTPSKIFDNKRAIVWYKDDSVFRTPKVEARFLFQRYHRNFILVSQPLICSLILDY